MGLKTYFVEAQLDMRGTKHELAHILVYNLLSDNEGSTYLKTEEITNTAYAINLHTVQHSFVLRHID